MPPMSLNLTCPHPSHDKAHSLAATHLWRGTRPKPVVLVLVDGNAGAPPLAVSRVTDHGGRGGGCGSGSFGALALGCAVVRRRSSGGGGGGGGGGGRVGSGSGCGAEGLTRGIFGSEMGDAAGGCRKGLEGGEQVQGKKRGRGCAYCCVIT
jgi:hypothetical protein